MEEVEFTENEKELKEVIKFIKEFFANLKPNDAEEKKRNKEAIESYEVVEDCIREYSERRFKRKQSEAKEAIDKLTAYHDEECPKCNFYTSLQAKGEEKEGNGFTYHIFQCPKCNAKFNGAFPTTDLEVRLFAKKSYEYLRKYGKDGRPNYVRLGVTKEELRCYQEHSQELQEALLKVEESIAKEKQSNKAYEEMVAKELARLTIRKYQLLNGNPIIGEA